MGVRIFRVSIGVRMFHLSPYISGATIPFYTLVQLLVHCVVLDYTTPLLTLILL